MKKKTYVVVLGIGLNLAVLLAFSVVADTSYETLLHKAIEEEDIQEAKAIIAEIQGLEAALEAEDKGRTPLHKAACKGLVDIVRMLIEAGANPDGSHELGYTPLGCAARWSYVEIANLLLAAGADVNSIDHLNRTPLWWATFNVTMVRLLLDYGAIPQLGGIGPTRDRLEPFMKAVDGGAIEIVRMMMAAGAKPTEDILYDATRHGMTEVMAEAIANGADVNKRYFGYNHGRLYSAPFEFDNDIALLMLATIYEQEKAVKLLIDAGAELGKVDITYDGLHPDRNPYELTALHAAARLGNTRIGKILIDAGAPLSDEKPKIGTRCPIMVEAAKYGHDEFIKMLVDEGVDRRGIHTPCLSR